MTTTLFFIFGIAILVWISFIFLSLRIVKTSKRLSSTIVPITVLFLILSLALIATSLYFLFRIETVPSTEGKTVQY